MMHSFMSYNVSLSYNVDLSYARKLSKLGENAKVLLAINKVVFSNKFLQLQ